MSCLGTQAEAQETPRRAFSLRIYDEKLDFLSQEFTMDNGPCVCNLQKDGDGTFHFGRNWLKPAFLTHKLVNNSLAKIRNCGFS